MPIFKNWKNRSVMDEEPVDLEQAKEFMHYDELTGLLNKEGMALDFHRLPDNQSYAYIIICMEKFIHIYSLFGFTAGDMNIATVAEVLRMGLGDGELICRSAPDQLEMVLIVQSEEHLIKRVELILERLRSLEMTDGASSYVYPRWFTCGIFEMQGKGDEFNYVRDMAALAMRTSRLKKETFSLYKKEMQEERNTLKKLLKDSEGAMEREEIVPYFHPKYDLNTGRIVGADILARWQHPEQGLILPNVFIPLMEQNGNIAELDIYMLEQACKLIQKWTENEAMPVPLSVNLSPLNIYKRDFTERITSMVKKYRTEPCLIELEMDEAAMFENGVYLMEYSHILRNAGFTLCIDNFGSSATSLKMLNELPISLIKLEKDWLRGDKIEQNSIIIKHIVKMANELGISIVSGGIETPQQVEMLKQIKCNQGMGFLFSKPMPLSAFEEQTL